MSESTREFFERVVKAARDRKRPSERNQRIADEVGVGGRTQVEVAAEYGLSQRRVSQICQQVDRWYSQTEARERGEVDGDAHWRVERELHKRQLTEVYRRSMRAFTRSERALQSQRSGKRADGQEWSEIGEREQRLDTASLRVALRVIEQQEKLSKRPEPREGSSDWERMKYFEWIVQSLARLRRDAECNGEVPRGHEDSRAIVERLVRELLGENGTGEPSLAGTKPGPGDVPEDVPPQVTESRFASGYCRGVEPEDDGVRDTQPSSTIHHWQDANATHSRSSSPSGVEERFEAPAAECVVAASDEAAPSCEPAAERKSLGEQGQKGSEKNASRIGSQSGQSGPTVPVGQAPPQDVASSSGPPRQGGPTLAQQEQRALGDFERQFGIPLTRKQADQAVTEILAQGTGHAAMQGYDQRQRAVLLEWQRLMRLRESGMGVPRADAFAKTPPREAESPGPGLVPAIRSG